MSTPTFLVPRFFLVSTDARNSPSVCSDLPMWSTVMRTTVLYCRKKVEIYFQVGSLSFNCWLSVFNIQNQMVLDSVMPHVNESTDARNSPSVCSDLPMWSTVKRTTVLYYFICNAIYIYTKCMHIWYNFIHNICWKDLPLLISPTNLPLP
jgi:hypothetical protein